MAVDRNASQRLIRELVLKIIAKLGGSRGSDHATVEAFWDAHRALILQRIKELKEEEIEGINKHGDSDRMVLNPGRTAGCGKETIQERFAAMIVATAMFAELRSTAHAATVVGRPALVLAEPAAAIVVASSTPNDWASSAIEVAADLGAQPLTPAPPQPARELHPPVSVPDWIPSHKPQEPINPHGPWTSASMVALDPNATRKQKRRAFLKRLAITLFALMVIPTFTGLVIVVMTWWRSR